MITQADLPGVLGRDAVVDVLSTYPAAPEMTSLLADAAAAAETFGVGRVNARQQVRRLMSRPPCSRTVSSTRSSAPSALEHAVGGVQDRVGRRDEAAGHRVGDPGGDRAPQRPPAEAGLFAHLVEHRVQVRVDERAPQDAQQLRPRPRRSAARGSEATIGSVARTAVTGRRSARVQEGLPLAEADQHVIRRHQRYSTRRREADHGRQGQPVGIALPRQGCGRVRLGVPASRGGVEPVADTLGGQQLAGAAPAGRRG